MPDNLVRRGGIWLFFRRTPIKFLHLEERSIVQQSTRIRCVDDPKGIAQPRCKGIQRRVGELLDRSR